MSCYQCTDKHISSIVIYACRAEINVMRYAYPPGVDQQIFDLLYAANVRSVNARYGEKHPLTGGVYQPDAPQLRPIELIKAVDGLKYQCDEWDGFEDSGAHKVLIDVQRYAVRSLPGYDAAKWSIE